MKDFIYKYGFFEREESIDFQGFCRIIFEELKVLRQYDYKCFLNVLK